MTTQRTTEHTCWHCEKERDTTKLYTLRDDQGFIYADRQLCDDCAQEYREDGVNLQCRD